MVVLVLMVGNLGQRELIELALKGMVNVLRAVKENGVKRVVVTLLISAVMANPSWPLDVVINEECWTNLEHCKQNGRWYTASKTMAEKAAREFVGEYGVDVMVINLGL